MTDLLEHEPTLAWRDGEWSAGALREAVDGLVRRLGELPGARVAIAAPNCPALVVALLAAWRAGAVAVPISARAREHELRQILADAEPAAVVTIDVAGGYRFGEVVPPLAGDAACLVVDAQAEVLTERAGAARAEPLGDEVAAILYTSGTTGEPKGALVTHASARHGARELAGILELTAEDATLMVVPAGHAFGFACLLASLTTGGRTVLVDSTMSVAPLADAAARHDRAVLHGSPALFAALLNGAPGALEGVRTGFTAGAPCPPALLERVDAVGPRILNLFGMTELGAAAACRLGDPPAIRHATVGRPVPGYEFRVAAGAELQVRGPHVTPGYFNQPELTAKAFEDGWFRTGDLGAIDADGVVTISGRAKEVAHVGGFNVLPAEVEGYLLTHPDVAGAGVVAVPDERMGEALHAYVVARPGSDVAPVELRAYARRGIAGYKVPSSIELVDELPLLASGKVDRAKLAVIAGA